MGELDEDKSGKLTIEEFEHSFSDPHIKQQLDALGTQDDLVRLFHLCDVDDGGTLDNKEFLDGVIRYEEHRGVFLQERIYEMVRFLKRTNWTPQGGSQPYDIEGKDSSGGEVPSKGFGSSVAPS